MPRISGRLKIAGTLLHCLGVSWITLTLVGVVASAFDMIAIRWVILYFLAPLIVIGAGYSLLTLILLVLGLTGHLPSDKDHYQLSEEDLEWR